MGRPRKNIEQEIEQEAGLAVLEPVTKKPNEFTDEYTLVVDTDYDPNADLFRIPNRDQNFQYRYLRDDQERLSVATSSLLHNQGGWQLVPKSHSLRIGFNERDLSEDGFRRIGKHILAFMPINLYEKKVAAKKQKTNTRTSIIKRHVADGIKVIGANNQERRVKDKSQKDNIYIEPGN